MIAQYWDWNLLYLVAAMSLSFLPAFLFMNRRRIAYGLGVIGLVFYLILHAYRPSLSAEIDSFTIPGRNGKSLEYLVQISPPLVFAGEAFTLIIRPPNPLLPPHDNPEDSLGCTFDPDEGGRIPHGVQTHDYRQAWGWFVRNSNPDGLSGRLKCSFLTSGSGVQGNAKRIVDKSIEVDYFAEWYRWYMYGLPVFLTIMNVFVICERLYHVRAYVEPEQSAATDDKHGQS